MKKTCHVIVSMNSSLGNFGWYCVCVLLCWFFILFFGLGNGICDITRCLWISGEFLLHENESMFWWRFVCILMLRPGWASEKMQLKFMAGFKIVQKIEKSRFSWKHQIHLEFSGNALLYVQSAFTAFYESLWRKHGWRFTVHSAVALIF